MSNEHLMKLIKVIDLLMNKNNIKYNNIKFFITVSKYYVDAVYDVYKDNNDINVMGTHRVGSNILLVETTDKDKISLYTSDMVDISLLANINYFDLRS